MSKFISEGGGRMAESFNVDPPLLFRASSQMSHAILILFNFDLFLADTIGEPGKSPSQELCDTRDTPFPTLNGILFSVLTTSGKLTNL